MVLLTVRTVTVIVLVMVDQLAGRHHLVRGSLTLTRADVPESTSQFIASRLSVTTEGCLEFIGARNTDGYGVVRLGHGRKARLAYVHRVTVALALGECPGDRVVDHLCRNRACANIWHLRLVTQDENVPGMVKRG